MDYGAAPAFERHPGTNDCSVWLYSCGEAFGYGSLARGDWDGFSDTDLQVVAANQDEAERAADQLMEALAGDPHPGLLLHLPLRALTRMTVTSRYPLSSDIRFWPSGDTMTSQPW
jgi:hypothetical protein